MNFSYKSIFTIFFISLFFGCKQAYNPPSVSSPGSYLVVEGVINSGTDSTIIKLSYTVNLANKVKLNPILNAAVAVESDQIVNYPLTETGNGKYFATNLNLDNSHKYRLTITTSDNKHYYSDYVPVLNAPPIDSIYFTLTNNALNIISTAHDPTNNVQYYRWDYNETWIINSAYYSRFKSNGDTVLTRDLVNDNIFQCWISDTSSTLVLNSTSKLKQALLTNNNITSVALNSEKLAHRYSILVNQYALTADAYNFWTNLKKNTESLGSIFDAQPSQINGNIHSASNASEQVIGYISVGTVASKRIFIGYSQLLLGPAITPYSSCIFDSLYYKFITDHRGSIVNQVNQYVNYNRMEFGGGLLIPIDAISFPGGPIIGFTAASPQCVDCTLRGTNKQPAFWK